jgi:hypothetical protein
VWGNGVGGHHARSKVPEENLGSLRFANHPGTLPQATAVHPSDEFSDSRWDFGPLGCLSSNVLPNYSRNDAVCFIAAQKSMWSI